MRRLLLDVNVVLDFLLDRPPFAEAALALWAAAEKSQVEAFIPAHGATTVFYIARRHRDARFARGVIQDLLSVACVATVDAGVLRRALALPGRDFEDAVCLAAAEAAGCEMLVTRDPSGYRGASLTVLDPDTAVSLLRGRPGEGVEDRPVRRSRPRRRAS